MELRKPTQVEIAKALGVSKSYITKRKDEGMPVDSIEAARVWNDNHKCGRPSNKEKEEAKIDPAFVKDITGFAVTIEVLKQELATIKAQHKSKEVSTEDYQERSSEIKEELNDVQMKRAEKLQSVLKLDELLDPKLNNDDSVEGRLARAEAVERLMFRYITFAAMTGNIGEIPYMQRNFTSASKDRTALQRDMVKYQEMVKELVDMKRVLLMVSYLLGPLQSRLAEMTTSIARLVAPENPGPMIELISETIEKSLSQIREDFSKWKKT